VSPSRGGPNSRCIGPRLVARGMRRGTGGVAAASSCTAGEVRSGRLSERRARLIERSSRDEEAAGGDVEAAGKSKPAVNAKLAGRGGEAGGRGIDDVGPLSLWGQRSLNLVFGDVLGRQHTVGRYAGERRLEGVVGVNGQTVGLATAASTTFQGAG
jgi:hypothetical protein